MAEKKDAYKVIAKNKKAFHDYEIEETFEAGLVLTGTEVRSLRDNSCQLTECFVLVRGSEAWLHGVHIKPYQHGTYNNVDPDRKRKLLLHKNQIRYLGQKSQVKGYAIVPLKLYFSGRNIAKVEIGIARGRKNYDKRAVMAERDTNREIQRALKERSRS
jgi:SsrA-binding protein